MNHALTVNGLTKAYHDFVLDNVSFHVPLGSIVGLIGQNGGRKKYNDQFNSWFEKQGFRHGDDFGQAGSGN
ncbi:hypothetical protein [Paenibacillus amylolyticus]|uniref:hypothetical protein n=1 Tax=Paenibacillus amylolyticus TaxID=1451 RepID=UPI0026A993F1